MPKRIITVGDPTDHGGVVVSGDPHRTMNGKPIARKGDRVNCPQKYPGGKPHGLNPIIEGSESYLLDGIPVALEGHRTACGCALIGTGLAAVG